jgi:ribosomal protein S18 acetylase RimI-like enzyme
VIRDVVPEDAAALAHVLITANEAAFRGRVPDQCLEFTEAESAANWQRMLVQLGLPAGDFMIVAQTSTALVVGYAWGGPRTQDTVYSGELRQLYVLPAYQRRGIGRRLVCHVAGRLAEQGLHSLRVEVLQVNPNRVFYERLGGTFVSQHPYDWDGVILPMYVYGWADSRSFLADQCDERVDVQTSLLLDL